MGESAGSQINENKLIYDKNNDGAVIDNGDVDLDKDIHTENIEKEEDIRPENIEKEEQQLKPKFVIPAVPLFTKSTNNNKINQPEEVKGLPITDLKDTPSCYPIKGKTTEENNNSNSNENTNNKKPETKSLLENKLLTPSGSSSGNAAKSKQKQSEFPYTQPTWGGAPTPSEHNKYCLTVLKDGTVRSNFDLSGKSLITFGRLPEACDVVVEHPSCSRYHAVLQYCIAEKDIRKVGYYIYDLGSTHGTYVNKEKVKPKVYVRVRVGYQIKFGGSSRLYIMEGPEEDQEQEIDMEEVRKIREINKQMRNEEKQRKQGAHRNDNVDDDDGASWGFREDAEEEELNLQDLMEKKKAIEVKDPKKTLNGFFEREGIDFEYEMSERGRGNNVVHVAHIRLPIESSYGTELIAEGVSSNKKDAVLNCATDACKIIQAYDMMQNTSREDQNVKRQRELEANDFYDSDDDTYLDRTGTIEKKRLKRKHFAGKTENQKVETHETLKAKLEEQTEMLHSLEKKLNLSATISKQGDEVDSLDAYMSSMKTKLDKTSERRIKIQVKELKEDIDRLEKLVEKTQPALPTFIMKNKTSVMEDKPFINNSSNATKCKQKVEKSTNKFHSHETINKTSIDEKVETFNIEEKESSSQAKKNKRVYGPAMMPMKKNDSVEKEFIEWLPPENQSGDGRTHLNDKLGY